MAAGRRRREIQIEFRQGPTQMTLTELRTAEELVASLIARAIIHGRVDSLGSEPEPGDVERSHV